MPRKTSGDVTEDNTESYGNEQQRLEIFLDGEPDEEGSHGNHNEVGYRRIGETRIGEELIKVANDEFCETHN